MSLGHLGPRADLGAPAPHNPTPGPAQPVLPTELHTQHGGLPRGCPLLPGGHSEAPEQFAGSVDMNTAARVECGPGGRGKRCGPQAGSPTGHPTFQGPVLTQEVRQAVRCPGPLGHRAGRPFTCPPPRPVCTPGGADGRAQGPQHTPWGSRSGAQGSPTPLGYTVDRVLGGSG